MNRRIKDLLIIVGLVVMLIVLVPMVAMGILADMGFRWGPR